MAKKPASQVRVRMYRQGLGDCFLLTFPRAGEPAHVLIDCGVLKGSEDGEARVRAVAADIVKTTSGHLDVLVVTHEHWDHVSGFVQAADILKDLKVGEVWMAWTEDPADDLGKELRKRRRVAKKAAEKAVRRLTLAGDFGARRHAARVGALLNFFGGLGAAGSSGRKTTSGALQWAKDRPRAKVRFFHPGETTEIPRLGSGRVYVLGPPHDKKQLKRSDPSKRQSEVYELSGDGGDAFGFLSALDVESEGTGDSEAPFQRFFGIADKKARRDRALAAYFRKGESWRQIESDWLGAAGRLALQLDSDTNNTSLALAFELSPSNRILLFPGDAQVGNWLSWQSTTWSIKEGRASREVTARELLERTVLYKVGHHGSHNATLREFGLEMMSSPELTAMVPVNRKTAKKMDWKMPFPALWTRLQEKTSGRVLDRDNGLVRPAGLTPRETAAWKRFADRVDVQPWWIDYTIDL
jgi:beta-lactamase superfamily II metal-dependent hydrolase